MFQKKMTADPDAAGDAAISRPGVAPAVALGGGKKLGKGGKGNPFGRNGGVGPSKSGGLSRGGGVSSMRGGRR